MPLGYSILCYSCTCIPCCCINFHRKKHNKKKTGKYVTICCTNRHYDGAMLIHLALSEKVYASTQTKWLDHEEKTFVNGVYEHLASYTLPTLVSGFSLPSYSSPLGQIVVVFSVPDSYSGLLCRCLSQSACIVCVLGAPQTIVLAYTDFLLFSLSC